jgi:probable F420-dependent oxidoreductase
MTDGMPLIRGLGDFGVWTVGAVSPETAKAIEILGYGTLWVGGSPSADLSFVEPILQHTQRLRVATGIVNIWSSPAHQVALSFHRIEEAFPGRFLLGVGAGHREHTQQYSHPFQAMVGYLDILDADRVPVDRRVLAALGPKVLDLAAQRSAGVHPYLTTPTHTRQARELVGPKTLLAPQQAVVLGTDPAAARDAARPIVDFYLGLTNYVNNWIRLGFTDEDLARPGSDRLIDAIVAHGSAEEIAHRLDEQVAAGADHVAIQVLNPDQLLPTLNVLARALRLPDRS